ncbi:MAG TPA: tRNA 2-thiouridine(34) synthase MnmA, partial [Rhodospirillales bacterium]|nr:tRNA 2-thiouridine(34) synthase MnmA [Rhodospirillales bacterium]
AGQDIHDARRVADRLGIAHYVLDYEARFRERVIDTFAEAYIAGETPVPCVRCNQRVKFEDLLETARSLGAVALATGHYVERRDGVGAPELHRGADVGRDQSYFLFATTRAQLAFLRFPLGSLGKDQTRDVARRLGLPVADKRDSQDICFVPDGSYADVLRRLRPEAQQPGEIVDDDGRVLGRHDGIAGFTVGQRRGLGIAAAEPLYVTRLDASRGRVVVGPKTELLRHRLRLREVNWLGDGEPPVLDKAVAVKLRSAMPAIGARIDVNADGGADVRLDAPYAAVAPGQACVFYDGSRVLGGGWIASEATGNA